MIKLQPSIQNKGNHQTSRRVIINLQRISSKEEEGLLKVSMLQRSQDRTTSQKVSILKKKKNNKRHHAHLAEDEDEEEEMPRKRLTKEYYVDDYVLFFALSKSITPGEDTWLLYSGASKHMTGKKQLA